MYVCVCVRPQFIIEEFTMTTTTARTTIDNANNNNRWQQWNARLPGFNVERMRNWEELSMNESEQREKGGQVLCTKGL